MLQGEEKLLEFLALKCSNSQKWQSHVQSGLVPNRAGLLARVSGPCENERIGMADLRAKL
jgi:hypothetical protein